MIKSIAEWKKHQFLKLHELEKNYNLSNDSFQIV